MSINEEFFFNCPLPMNALIQSLTDEQLDKLHSLAWTEKQKRTVKNVREGKYPSLNEDEKRLAKTAKINAIMVYNTRTKLGIYISKAVVEFFLDT